MVFAWVLQHNCLGISFLKRLFGDIASRVLFAWGRCFWQLSAWDLASVGLLGAVRQGCLEECF